MKAKFISHAKEKFKAVKRLLEKEISGKTDLPDNVIVFALTDFELSKIFTRKRIELIRTIKQRNPKTIKQLADMVKRHLSAVDRDIKMLEDYGIVSLVRNKEGVQPVVKKDAIILPLSIKAIVR